MVKLIGYVRVSSDSQADNTSLDEQINRIRAYCDAFSYELVEVLSEVGSGKDIDSRPVFNQALDKIKGDEADGIIVTKLDRLARNSRDVLTLVEDVLEPHNKILVMLDLNVDTSSPTGKMILTVMSAVAELERNTINERTQGGRKAKAKKGGYAYGKPKYGYKSVDGELVPDKDEQATIKLIKNHRRSGKSYQKITDYLNTNSIPTKQGKGKWSVSVVHRILTGC